MSDWECDVHRSLTEFIRPLVEHPDVVERGLELRSMKAEELGSFDKSVIRRWME